MRARIGATRGYRSHHLRDVLAFAGWAQVELRVHAALGAFARDRLFIFLADRRIFPVIRDGAAALGEVDRSIIVELLAGPTGLAGARIVGTEPCGQPQRLLG